MRRVWLIGLDCVPPALAFDRYAEHMPCLSGLIEGGAHARLASTFPPITVPAWTSMVSGRDPGELGLYGFRRRDRGSYGLSLVTSEDVRVERVWDVLARRGKRSSVLFVPPSQPPFPVAGELVSCFLTPHADLPHTFPRPLAGELAARFGRYVPDVEVRKGDREGLGDALIAMTRQHFQMARHVLESREPDFMMMVEIGPDRLHHAFWAEMDPSHPAHDPRSPHRGEGERYYAALDRELAALVALADDDTAVLVASDHGAKPLRGAFCINEWLVREGLLVLRAAPREPSALSPDMVDWSRTRVWAEGGYYARVFLNVAGREPCGIVAPSERTELARRVALSLSAVTGEGGEAWNNRVEMPETLYREVNGDAPDLLAVFDDLSVRPLSLVGGGQLYAPGDDRGADACNHDVHGIFVLHGAGVSARGDLGECSIHDVGATVLSLFDAPLPEGWLGRDRSRA